MSPKLSRRDVLKTTSGIAAWPLVALADQNRSVQNIIRVGVIGTGVRGKYLIGNLPQPAKVVALCDCVSSQIAGTLEPQEAFASILQSFRDGSAGRCAIYQDYRRMIDREQLDAVIIATPDHHHSLAAMLAMQAGLDVYLEKPLTVTVREGRQLASLVQKTGRVLQVGSQQRTMDVNRFACEFVRGGGLGKISRVELPNYPGPIANPDFPAQMIPEGLDWDLFIGPARRRAYHRKLWSKDAFTVDGRLWRGWDLFQDYSGHLMTNWGAHSIDMMQYALGTDDAGPLRVEAIRPESAEAIALSWSMKTPSADGVHDSRLWPVTMQYPGDIEVQFQGPNRAMRIEGELGTIAIRRNHYVVDPPELIEKDLDATVAQQWDGDGHVARPHLQNWLDCIRTRKRPNAPVEVGHRTATVCHLANIARQLQRPLNWNPQTEQFDDHDANQLLERPRRAGFELPDT